MHIGITTYKGHITLSIGDIAAHDMDEAIKLAYDILDQVSENPVTVYKDEMWLQCVYKAPNGTDLTVLYDDFEFQSIVTWPAPTGVGFVELPL